MSKSKAVIQFPSGKKKILTCENLDDRDGDGKLISLFTIDGITKEHKFDPKRVKDVDGEIMDIEDNSIGFFRYKSDRRFLGNWLGKFIILD